MSKKDRVSIIIDGDARESVKEDVGFQAEELFHQEYGPHEVSDILYGPKNLVRQSGTGTWRVEGLPVVVLPEHSEDPWDSYEKSAEKWELPYVTDLQMRIYIAAGGLEAVGDNRWNISNDGLYDVLAINMQMEGLLEEREAIEKMARCKDPSELEDLHYTWDDRLKNFDGRLMETLTLGVGYADSLKLGVPIPTDTKSVLDPKGNIVLGKFGDDAVLMRGNCDSFQPFVIAHGYDEKTGEWSQGDYRGNLAAALDEANPNIIDGATIRWSMEDIQIPLYSELEERGIDTSNLSPREFQRLVDEVLDETLGDKRFVEGIVESINDSIYSESAIVADRYCETVDVPTARAEAARHVAASQGDSTAAKQSIHH